MINGGFILEKDDAVKKLTMMQGIVLAAMAERNKFIEKNKHLFAEFKIGQKVKNIENGIIGVVTEHYHHAYGYPENQGYYAEFNIHCRIEYVSELGVNHETNTSRAAPNHFWVAVEE
jgi:hypothetical protein